MLSADDLVEAARVIGRPFSDLEEKQVREQVDGFYRLVGGRDRYEALMDIIDASKDIHDLLHPEPTYDYTTTDRVDVRRDA